MVSSLFLLLLNAHAGLKDQEEPVFHNERTQLPVFGIPCLYRSGHHDGPSPLRNLRSRAYRLRTNSS